MRKWKAIFADDIPNEATIQEGDLGADALKRFDEVWNVRNIDGRKIIAMWIIDKATEQEDVIKIAGKVPIPINERYVAYGNRRKTPNLPP